MKNALRAALVAAVLSPAASAQSVFVQVDGSPGSKLGRELRGVGDVDGDQVEDVVVTSHGEKRAYAISGADGSAIHTFSDAAQSFGVSVGVVDDLDGDAIAEVLVGSAVGVLKVYSGGSGGELKTLTSGGGDLFGITVAGIGDWNMDGTPDFAVGSPNFTVPYCCLYQGKVQVFSGADWSELWSRTGGVFDSDRGLGNKVAAAGDMNGDGHADLVVGTNWTWGEAYVYSGATGNVMHTVDESASATGSDFGESLRGAGDVNADGFPDFVIGAPSWTEPGGTMWTGAARVYSGENGSLLQTLLGDNSQDYFGASVDCAGDLNADGFADVLVGAPTAPGAGIPPSNAYVRAFSGADWSLLHHVGNPPWVDGVGKEVGFIGDLDDDGFEDFAFAAHDGEAGTLRLAYGCNGFLGTYGAGLAGTDGLVPRIGSSGGPHPGWELAIEVGDGLPGASGFLGVGLDYASLPLFGGTMLQTGEVTIAHVLDQDGEVALPWSIPALPPGFLLYFQAAYLDAGAPFGVSMTRGLWVLFA